MVPYPIADHVPEIFNYPEKGNPQELCEDTWPILNLSWSRKRNFVKHSSTAGNQVA